MAREFFLEVTLENAAFEVMPGATLAEILEKTASRVRDLGDSESGDILDPDGNTVGSWTLIYEAENDGDDDDDEENAEGKHFFGSCYEPEETSEAESTVYVGNPVNGKKASVPLPIPPHIVDSASEWLEAPIFGAGIDVKHINSVVDRDYGQTLIEVSEQDDENAAVFNLHMLHRTVESLSEENLDQLRALLYDRKHSLAEALEKARSVTRANDSVHFYHDMTLEEVVAEMVNEALSGIEWLVGYVDEEALARDLKGEYRETPWGVLNFLE